MRRFALTTALILTVAITIASVAAADRPKIAASTDRADVLDNFQRRITQIPTRTPTPQLATPTPAARAAAAVAQPATSNVLRVPADVATLQTAIQQVTNGGVIEIAAGSYASPAGGFSINNQAKTFTIRAASGATVVLDGGGTRDVLRLINNSLASGRPVTFERLTFANGRSTSEGIAGGVTLQHAQATFDHCVFQNNSRPAAVHRRRRHAGRPGVDRVLHRLSVERELRQALWRRPGDHGVVGGLRARLAVQQQPHQPARP